MHISNYFDFNQRITVYPFNRAPRCLSEATYECTKTAFSLLNVHPDTRSLLFRGCILLHGYDFTKTIYNMISGNAPLEDGFIELLESSAAISAISINTLFPYFYSLTANAILLATKLESLFKDALTKDLPKIGWSLFHTFSQTTYLFSLLKGPSQRIQNALLNWSTLSLLCQSIQDAIELKHLEKDSLKGKIQSAILFFLCWMRGLQAIGSVNRGIPLLPSLPSATKASLLAIPSYLQLELEEASTELDENLVIDSLELLLELVPLLPTFFNLSVLAPKYQLKKAMIELDDVAGCTKAKEAIEQIAYELKHPDEVRRLQPNAPSLLPKGLLFYGPPGTGKTMVAEAFAKAIGAKRFIVCTASEFVAIYVGTGPRALKQVFAAATKKNPCVIFIDEINAIGTSRFSSFSSSQEYSNTTETFLTEIEQATPGAVIVIGATNLTPEQLDPAFVREGRFDRHIEFTLPKQQERRELLERLRAKTYSCEPGIDWEQVLRQTEDCSGAGLVNLMREAALDSLKRHRRIDQAGIDVALESLRKRKERTAPPPGMYL